MQTTQCLQNDTLGFFTEVILVANIPQNVQMFSSKEKDEEQSICHAVLTIEEMLRLSVVYLQCSSSFVSLAFLLTRQNCISWGLTGKKS